MKGYINNIINKYNLSWLGLIIASYLIIFGLIQVDIIDVVYQDTLISIAISIVMALGLNLIVGFTGQFSLGHAGFMAIGAYACAIVTLKMPDYLGFALGVIVGIIVASIVALIVGIPTLRLRGDYLAIATLGISEIIRIIILNFPNLTNGPAGLSNIPQLTSWQLCFVMVVITAIVIANFIRSRHGRACIAIREDEIAAESMGINVVKYKTISFVIGAIFASVAGALYSSYFYVIKPESFGFMKSIDILIIVVFGGMGSITGTIIAAIALGALNVFLQSYGEVRMIIYGVLLVAIMIFRPGGLFGTYELRMKKLLGRFSKKQEGLK